MAIESSHSSRSDGNSSEMVPESRPIMTADLFLAAVKGNSEVLYRSLGLPVEEQDHIKVTLENSTSETQEIEEDEEVVEYNLESATTFGDTILHILIANGHNDFALKVFQKDASLLKARNMKFETPLHHAARFGNVDIIGRFIQFAPTDLMDASEETNNDGDTALHLAAKHGHPHVGMMLLELNRELVYKVNKEGFSPFHVAIVKNQQSMIKHILLFDNSLGSVQFWNGQFPVHVAAIMGNISLILFLLKDFPDYANLHDQNGRNFFHIAADENIDKVFTREVRIEGADMLHKKDCDGNTPLHIAIKKGNIAIMRAILESLPSYVPQENNKGDTPFDFSDFELKDMNIIALNRLNLLNVNYRGRNLGSILFNQFMLGPAKDRWERGQLVGLGSVLITTVAFAAAFTFAGGYSENTGVPVLGRRFMFRAFILANALAFMQSFLCVFLLVLGVGGNLEGEIQILSNIFLAASSSMMLAFGTGSYVMLAPVNMPIAIIVLIPAMLLGSPPLVVILYFLHLKLFGKSIYHGLLGRSLYMMGLYVFPFVFAFCLAFLK